MQAFLQTLFVVGLLFGLVLVITINHDRGLFIHPKAYISLTSPTGAFSLAKNQPFEATGTLKFYRNSTGDEEPWIVYFTPQGSIATKALVVPAYFTLPADGTAVRVAGEVVYEHVNVSSLTL